jgi:hypothetical protein
MTLILLSAGIAKLVFARPLDESFEFLRRFCHSGSSATMR